MQLVYEIRGIHHGITTVVVLSCLCRHFSFKEQVLLRYNLPPLTSHDISADAPSGYGPSCEVASRPASFTMTGGLGGTEKSMENGLIDSTLCLLSLRALNTLLLLLKT